MKLTFSEARKRREQFLVRGCEAINLASIGLGFCLTLVLIVHNILR